MKYGVLVFPAEKLRICTMICPMVERNPMTPAKELAGLVG
jgi:hypothetical protein